MHMGDGCICSSEPCLTLASLGVTGLLTIFVQPSLRLSAELTYVFVELAAERCPDFARGDDGLLLIG